MKLLETLKVIGLVLVFATASIVGGWVALYSIPAHQQAKMALLFPEPEPQYILWPNRWGYEEPDLTLVLINPDDNRKIYIDYVGIDYVGGQNVISYKVVDDSGTLYELTTRTDKYFADKQVLLTLGYIQVPHDWPWFLVFSMEPWDTVRFESEENDNRFALTYIGEQSDGTYGLWGEYFIPEREARHDPPPRGAGLVMLPKHSPRGTIAAFDADLDYLQFEVGDDGNLVVKCWQQWSIRWLP